MADTAMELERQCGFHPVKGHESDKVRTQYGRTPKYLYRRIWDTEAKTCRYHRLPNASVPEGFVPSDPSTHGSLPKRGWTKQFDGSDGSS